ncbi:Glycosyl transferase family 14 [Arabidopsis suecica]|uniref:Glycosyl transferase family 14 n=1 Tax=Arabidopsis suecica TaxID=45249 RepID=A0A8T1ZX96_ARASU|nr:Glycosyl transferase family 14 [Arabidopsis suecica]
MFSSSTLVYSLSLFLSLSLLFFLFFLSPHILLSSSNLISTADDLDDLSLFHRAAVSSSTNNRRLISLSPNPPPKIAFLFLTNSDLTFLPLWESFFQGHQDLYNVYIHADPTSSVSPLLDSSSINAKFIPAKRTARASPTLISAERRLLANAILDDPNNLYFALISQHCIPLHSFSYIHNHLFSTNSDHHQSFIEILSDEPFLPKRYNARGDDAMLPEIRYQDFRVGSQFFVLAKRHALMVIKERKLWRKFKLPCLDVESCYPEEHYFPTLLSLEDPEGCSHFTLTRVNWTGSVGGHPHTYDASEVSPQLIHSLRRSNSSLDYFFARKFTPESLQPLMEIADAVIFRD